MSVVYLYKSGFNGVESFNNFYQKKEVTLVGMTNLKFKSLTEFDLFTSHFQYFLGGERPMCSICNRSFYNKSFLRRHVLEQHEKDPRLQCKTCNHFFLRKDNLEAHIFK